MVVIMVALAACGSKDPANELANEARCKEATLKLEALWSAEVPGTDFSSHRAREREIEHCMGKYTNAVVDCMVVATSVDGAHACYTPRGSHPKSDGAVRAKLLVKKLAFEAYPMWARDHADLACPAAPSDLAKYIDTLDDPWGHPLRIYCGANLPPGARGFAAASAGPDGAFDTADDIKSW
jgi:hypothetical protein